MGTLDPQGEGVLLLGVGKGARLFDFFLSKDKVYEATFKFGYETDTLDKDGTITSNTDTIPAEEDIRAKLSEMVGEQLQLPPKYSAKNIDGKRAYDLAREGKDFELKPCKITIYDAQLLSKVGENEFLFRIHCSGGTYIRSICRDLAYSLGSLATMTSIKRTKCGKFNVKDAVKELDFSAYPQRYIIPLSEVLSDLPRYDVPDEDYAKLLNGVSLVMTQDFDKPFTVWCKGELFGLGEIIDGKLIVKTNLKE
jgi:tRNA pseudouridine55 synthase